MMSVLDDGDRSDLMQFLSGLDIEYCRVMHERIREAREKARKELDKKRRTR